jgi:acetyl-CoA acyltransferase 1
VAPRIMGIGPSVAIPKALSQAGISKEDVDLFEVTFLNILHKSVD